MPVFLPPLMPQSAGEAPRKQGWKFQGQPPLGFSGMQLPSEPGAFVTTTPGHGGFAQPLMAKSHPATRKVLIRELMWIKRGAAMCAILAGMDTAFMDTPKWRAMAAALTTTGHVNALAEALETTPRLVARWLDGMDPVPDDVYTSALQIVRRTDNAQRHHA